MLSIHLLQEKAASCGSWWGGVNKPQKAEGEDGKLYAAKNNGPGLGFRILPEKQDASRKRDVKEIVASHILTDYFGLPGVPYREGAPDDGGNVRNISEFLPGITPLIQSSISSVKNPDQAVAETIVRGWMGDWDNVFNSSNFWVKPDGTAVSGDFGNSILHGITSFGMPRANMKIMSAFAKPSNVYPITDKIKNLSDDEIRGMVSDIGKKWVHDWDFKIEGEISNTLIENRDQLRKNNPFDHYFSGTHPFCKPPLGSLLAPFFIPGACFASELHRLCSEWLHKDNLTPVPGLSQFAFMKVDPKQAASEEGRKAIADGMIAAMRKWPALSAVISMAPDGSGNTSLIVAGREGAESESRLAGAYEVVQRLASSPFIKEQAKKFPTSFATVKPFDADGKTSTVRLPGMQTPESVTKALLEGGKPNQADQLADLIANLPKGKRVALLIAGPSAAGKSTLASQIRQLAGARRVVDFSGDMYFRDSNDPKLPKTAAGTPFWDDPEAMHFDQMTDAIAGLIKDGKADIPNYSFKTSAREPGSTHVELGSDDILVIDSLHAANPKLIDKLEALNLAHVTIYLDSPSADDRLVRRLVRDFNERGRSPERTISDWDQTTFPGEVKFVRPTIFQLDPARDLFYVTKFPKDPGLTRKEIDVKLKAFQTSGTAPSYEAFATR